MEHKIKNNKILMSIASLGSATLLNAILVFVVEIINRNLLGPEKYGYWLTISLVFTFIPIFQLGTLNAMNREVPFYLARGDFKQVKKIRDSVFSFIFTVPIFLVVILLAISGILLFTNIRYEYKLGLIFASFISFCTYLTGYAEMYYKSEQKFKKASKLISIKSISQSLLTIALVFFWGYIGLYLGMLMSILIEIYLAKEIFPSKKKVFALKEYKNLIIVGFPILLVGLVWSLMIATDRIVISIFMTPKDLGNYGVGMLVFNAMMLFPQVISQVLYPKIVELVSMRNFDEIKRFYLRTNKILAIIMLLIVIIGYCILPFFITWFLPSYKSGIKVSQILLIGVYPLTLVGLAACYFNSTNNQKLYLVIQVVSILLNIFLCSVFMYFSKSITSVALATSISFFVYSILMNSFFWINLRESKRISFEILTSKR